MKALLVLSHIITMTHLCCVIYFKLMRMTVKREIEMFCYCHVTNLHHLYQSLDEL